MVTGGTGTLGRAVCRDILSRGSRVRVYARTVQGHETLKAPLTPIEAPRVTTVIGSLSSYVTLSRATRNVQYLIHAAAMKDITYCEDHPLEAIETNVEGTANVVQVCIERQIPRCVFISTDKAAAPTTHYGATKLLGERLWLGSKTYTGGEAPDFVAVRYGNVWGSARSVLHKFQEQQEKKGFLTITDPRATRFHITLSQAVGLVLRVLHEGKRGTLTVPKLPTYSVGDLAQAWINVTGTRGPTFVTGLRPSEKLHEDLISANETNQIVSQDDQSYTLNPLSSSAPLSVSYSSGDRSRRLSVEKLEQEIITWRSESQGVPSTPSPSERKS